VSTPTLTPEMSATNMLIPRKIMLGKYFTHTIQRTHGHKKEFCNCVEFFPAIQIEVYQR
jgi:hypothetical protein